MHLIAMQYITKTVATIPFAIYSPSYYHFFFHFSTNFGLANPSLVISEVKEVTLPPQLLFLSKSFAHSMQLGRIKVFISRLAF